ncbi:MAG TPA: L-threonylcarbamoyladenylate synthase [Candidatus Nanoarchaeia archaeon]|nr:L-threonylcarbamoyladenylate synthase [Candidatus Nanoarchaeia archaeon]
MKIITKNEFLENSDFYFNEIKSGKIFVYPTDTIYGIGCDAVNEKSITKIREIKQRESKPMSVIIPNIEWIEKNCFIDKSGKKELEKLPGPFTFILKLKNFNSIAKDLLIGDLKSIGVRIPDNWFSSWLSKNKLVFVTTSVNVSGEPHLVDPKNLKKEIGNKIDYLISDEPLTGNPSKIINLINKEILRD